jgi:hypothetical protein
MFLHSNIIEYIWTSPDGKADNQLDHILIERDGIQVSLMHNLSGEL